ncbi:MAG: hypothetical protein HQL91_13295 [Magnetococcales bacterium]|nr:hypothetical protein [Magnetococcales bacterium]
MSLSDDPWELPSASAFLAEIEGAVATGGALVTGGASMPPNLEDAIAKYFRDRNCIIERIEASSDMQPAETLASAFTVTAEAGALANATHLADHLAIVTPLDGNIKIADDWRVFLLRFLKVRAQQGEGLAVLFLAKASIPGIDGLPLLAWNGRLRRIDVTIWADLHAQIDRPEPLATLSAALAVELCGWRLDLAAEIARARREDILNPIGWLSRQVGLSFSASCRLNGQEMACPIALLKQGDTEEINHRIWRAELAALFPWIEERRQRVIIRHRRLLRLDEHLRALNVRAINEIEFGALSWQLHGQVTRAEQEMIDCLARLRNRLAHGKAVEPADLDRALRESSSWE